jgi:predicted GNAT family acetyltransferase
MSAATDGAEDAVRHDARARRFVVRLPDGEAELAYMEPERGVLELHHTFVPESARGQGVGDRLVEAAIAHAREEGARIIPTCPFVRAYTDEHPEVRDLLVR